MKTNRKFILFLSFFISFLFSPAVFSQQQEEVDMLMPLIPLMEELQKYRNEQNYKEILRVALEVEEIMRLYLYSEYGSQREDVSNTYVTFLSIIGNGLLIFDKTSEATEYFRKGLEVLEKKGYTDTNIYGSLLDGMSEVYRRNSDFDLALRYSLQSADLYTRLYSNNSTEYANVLKNIGRIYTDKGEVVTGFGYYEEALSIHKEIGTENRKYANLLLSISQSYRDGGNLSKALELILECTEIIKKEYGEADLPYATILGTVAQNYLYMGDFESAISYAVKGLEIMKNIGAEGSSAYCIALNNYAHLLSKMGDYEAALRYYQQSISIKQNLFEIKTVDEYTILLNISNLYIQKKEYEKALEYGLLARDGFAELTGDKSLNFASVLNTIGLIYHYLNEYEKAANYFNEAISTMEEMGLLTHSTTATIYNNFASLYLDSGKPDLAIEFAKSAKNIGEQLYGKDHPEIKRYIYNLAIACFLKGDYTEAAHVYSLIVPGITNEVSTNFIFMTEHERELFWNTVKRYGNLAHAFLYHFSSQDFIALNYNMALFTKGLLLNSSLEFSKLILNSGNKEAIQNYETLKMLRSRIDQYYENPNSALKEQVEQLTKQATTLERTLLGQAKELGYYTEHLTTSWQDVKRNITDKDLCIEFIDFWWIGKHHYGALVLHKGMEAPQYVPLFELSELENLQWEENSLKDLLGTSDPYLMNKIYENPQISQMLWKPLQKHMTGKKNIWFSATGILHQLAIEYLIVEEATRINDLFTLHRLSSTRQLVNDRTPEEQLQKSAVLYGGLNYNSDPALMMAYAEEYGRRGVSIQGEQGGAYRNTLWSYLRGTRKEVETIAPLLEEQNYTTTVYTESEGVEESFKALSGQSPSLLHIATHGFYSPQEEYLSKPGSFTPPSEGITDFSLYRSGLVFAGANNFWNKREAGIYDMDDGILTAKEISQLDLRGTELVVLSACQTGLGEITGEGVFGLQRAFKKAGVQTLLISLWEVHDEATQIMMTRFYQLLAQGHSKREAHYLAQQKVMEHTFTMDGKEYSGKDPYFWAGFIMLD